MLELISLCLETGNLIPLLEISKDLMSRQEREIVGWINEFYSMYGKPPLVAQVQKEFPYFLPIRFTEDEIRKTSVMSVVDSLKKDRIVELWASKLQEALILAREEKKIPADIIDNLLKVTAASDGISTFSSFDRGKYFREPGLKIGVKLIDNATGGVSGGEMMVIAGRLGTGKTTISLFIAYKWWELGKKVLFISNEMLDADIFARMDGIVGHFNPLKIRTGDADEMKKAAFATGVLVSTSHIAHGGEIYIPSRRVNTPSEVFALAKHLMVDAVIIDGLYLMQPDGGHYAAKWEKVAEISNQLKMNALNSNLPLVALTQIKRTGGRKDVYDPEDIAYSDSIGQDADFIVSISPAMGIKGRFELQLIKNRFGKEIATICSIDYDTMKMVEDSTTLREDGEFFSAAKVSVEAPVVATLEKPTDDGEWVLAPVSMKKERLWTD